MASDTATPELNAALAKLQTQLPHIPKGEKGKVEGVTKQGKPFSYEYNYADLHGVSAAVLPLMGDLGLAFTTMPTFTDAGKFVLAYSLRHSSGEHIDGTYGLPDPDRLTPQQVGGAITYARRYCLCAVTGAAPAEDDDDAQSASKAKPPARQQRAQRPPARPAATPARTRTTGAEHERLRHGAVEPTPDDRAADRGPLPPGQDHWEGQPAGQLRRPSGSNGGTVGMIQQHFKRLEVTDREERLALTAQLAGWAEGREITSTNDLSHDEASGVLAQLSKIRDHAALMGLVLHGDRGGSDE